jgi:hypothetical protein
VLGDQVSHQERIMPMELPTAVEATVGGGLTPIRAAVALSVFMFGMLAGADIAARVMPPVQDDGSAYLLHLLPSSWPPLHR